MGSHSAAKCASFDGITPAEISVTPCDYVEQWGDMPATMLDDSLTEGHVLAQA